MTGTHDPPETTPDEELPDEGEGAVDGELSDELELLELEEPLELEVPLEPEVPPADDVFAPLACCVVLVPDVAWCVPAAAAATPPVRTAAPTAMPRVARRIIFRPRARRCGPDRGTGARRLRSSEAGLR
jgi:hypothetical protein